MLAEAAGPDQRAANKMRPGHCTKKFRPGSPEVTFWGPIHHLPKATLPCWKNTNTVILLDPYCGTMTEPGLPVARLGEGFIGLQGFTIGICNGLVDWIWMKYWEVYCAVVYGSAQTIRVVSQIYRERTIEEVSANQERLTSSNQIKLIG